MSLQIEHNVTQNRAQITRSLKIEHKSQCRSKLSTNPNIAQIEHKSRRLSKSRRCSKSSMNPDVAQNQARFCRTSHKIDHNLAVANN
mmetsp:Transcript_25131/g.52553  ORF Transcript_25131/g.52553 Transcript_25131/m.52553 type:complete len:87 (-) Transcript_25131:668-928(-)